MSFETNKVKLVNGVENNQSRMVVSEKYSKDSVLLLNLDIGPNTNYRNEKDYLDLMIDMENETPEYLKDNEAFEKESAKQRIEEKRKVYNEKIGTLQLKLERENRPLFIKVLNDDIKKLKDERDKISNDEAAIKAERKRFIEEEISTLEKRIQKKERYIQTIDMNIAKKKLEITQDNNDTDLVHRMYESTNIESPEGIINLVHKARGLRSEERSVAMKIPPIQKKIRYVKNKIATIESDLEEISGKDSRRDALEKNLEDLKIELSKAEMKFQEVENERIFYDQRASYFESLFDPAVAARPNSRNVRSGSNYRTLARMNRNENGILAKKNRIVKLTKEKSMVKEKIDMFQKDRNALLEKILQIK